MHQNLQSLPETLLQKSPYYILAVVYVLIRLARMSSATTNTRCIICRCTAMFLDLANLSAVTIALPTIQKDLNVKAAELQWTISAYALTVSPSTLAVLGLVRRTTPAKSCSLAAFSFLGDVRETFGGMRSCPIEKQSIDTNSLQSSKCIAVRHVLVCFIHNGLRLDSFIHRPYYCQGIPRY